jgi:peptidoglycan hydrolase CwlO-like protein
MSKLSQQVSETKAEIASMTARIDELEKPLEKPVAKDFSNSNDYLIAVRNHENAERDRVSQISAIEEFLPLTLNRLEPLEAKLKAEKRESREFYQSLIAKVEKFCSDYEEVRKQYEELQTLVGQTPQSWRSQHQGEQILSMNFPKYAFLELRISPLDRWERFAFYYGQEMVQKFHESQLKEAAIAG